MNLKDRIIREHLDSVTNPSGSEFVDSLGREHETASGLMRAEIRYMLRRKF